MCAYERLVVCLHMLWHVPAGARSTDSCPHRCSASRCARSGCRRTLDPSSLDQQAFQNRTSSSGLSSSDNRSLWMLRVPDTVAHLAIGKQIDLNASLHRPLYIWDVDVLALPAFQVLVASNREAGRALLAGDIWALVGWSVLICP